MKKTLAEVPNLDCMDVEEVEKYRKKIYPERYLDEEGWDAVRGYCEQKILAVKARSTGRTQEALMHESVCDALYRRHLQGKVDW